MTRYELFLFLHLVSAIVWLGAGVLFQLLVFRMEQIGDRATLKALGDSAEWLTKRLFIPASLSTLVFGIALVWDGPWTFGQLFVVVALAGLIGSFLVGIGMIEPQAKRVAALIEEHGPAHPAVGRGIRRINIISRAELVILFVVVADMAMKPRSEDTGTVIALAAVAAAAVGAAIWLLRAPAAETPESAPATTR